MKCPLLTIGLSAVAAKEAVEMEDCIKEECAWWDEAEAQCAVLALLTWAPHLVSLLRAIKEKMPHEEQFQR